jgi:hypothetical protein
VCQLGKEIELTRLFFENCKLLLLKTNLEAFPTPYGEGVGVLFSEGK